MKIIANFWEDLRKKQLKIQRKEREKRLSIYDLYNALIKK